MKLIRNRKNTENTINKSDNPRKSVKLYSAKKCKQQRDIEIDFSSPLTIRMSTPVMK